jgi:hypothetical protein
LTRNFWEHRPEFDDNYGMEVAGIFGPFAGETTPYWYGFCLNIIKLLDNASDFPYGENLNEKK